MPIHFDSARWDKVRATYRQWWAGTLDRPVFIAASKDRDPGRPMPDAPLLSMANCTDLSIPAEQLIDRIDWELSHYTWQADAFPFVNMWTFGAGVVAAFLGARMESKSGTVWFHPPRRQPIADIHFRFDPDNVWFRRICDIYKAGMDRWQGQVLMGMTDLGGVLDILSVFRPGEELLTDLYDEPQEVHRLIGEAYEVWHQYFDAINEFIKPVTPGYAAWANIYSEEPGYMLQSDFSYMIGPEMFDEFVRPELAWSSARIPYAFYHMDGKGQIPHLDSLLSIADLKGIQWVAGSGAPGIEHWAEIYQRCVATGKKIQTGGPMEALDTVVGQIGVENAGAIHHGAWISDDQELKKVAKYGAEIF